MKTKKDSTLESKKVSKILYFISYNRDYTHNHSFKRLTFPLVFALPFPNHLFHDAVKKHEPFC